MVPTQSPRSNGRSRKTAAKPAVPAIDPAERERYVAEAAYYLAERRGFTAGMELEDWLAAEQQIASLIPRKQ